jgi:thioredoxin reductase (NADPH)
MSTESILTIVISGVLIGAALIPYFVATRRRERAAEERFKQTAVAGLQSAPSMHPHFNALACIGCGGCVAACPEGDVLGVIDGKATLVHGAQCVGHGVCAEACPVGAITLLMAEPGRSANLPILDASLQTTVPGIYIAGELGGMGLIRNAVVQGIQAMDQIAKLPRSANGIADVVIVGAGPAGLAAALAAKKHELRYVLLEQNDVGGSILHYPRRKVVLTSPVMLPLWGRLAIRETSKEALLETWDKIIARTGLKIHTGEKVIDIARENGAFTLRTPVKEYRAMYVVLALGRRGTPRKLGVPGEELPKVMYQLADAETYRQENCLVVGGGDSALEAALGLSLHGRNAVTLAYRGRELSRVRERNRTRLDEAARRKQINLLLGSNVAQILPDAVQIATPTGPLRMPNSWVFVCAGGELPFDFLRKIGIGFHEQLV